MKKSEYTVKLDTDQVANLIAVLMRAEVADMTTADAITEVVNALTDQVPE